MKLNQSTESTGPLSKLPKEFESYKPKITFCMDEGNFLIKIAETKEELWGAFFLRNQVFYEEWTGQSAKSNLDIDQYDAQSDHLLVMDKQSHTVFATYRLSSTHFNHRFYTQEFFHIDSFLKGLGNKVEVGRACTHKSLRGSQIIQYILKGLLRYFRLTESRYMFGSVSIINTSPKHIAGVYSNFLKKNIVDNKTATHPVAKYQIANFDKHILECSLESMSTLKLPRLFLWYLSLGVKVHGLPVYDPEFGSYDFFISLDFKKIIKNPKIVNRYEDAVWLKNNLPN